MTRLRAIGLGFFLLAAACDSPTAPTQVNIEFESGIVFGIPTLSTAARVEGGELIITGVLQVPTTGFNLLGELTRSGTNRLQLEIHAYDNSPGAPFQVSIFYRATVRNLRMGAYDLSVLHTYHAPSPGYSRRVYHDTIRVE